MNNDLISRSALIAAIKTNSPTFYDGQDIANWQAKCINEAPAVDAEPVRHGKWLYVGYGKPDAWDCSECSVMVAKQHFYCPRCGAKIEGRTNDE